MMSVIEDDQLTFELQELYYIGKEWIADLNTLNMSFGISRQKLLETTNAQKVAGNKRDISDISVVMDNVESQYSIIMKDIEGYLNTLRPLINKSNRNYDLALIEQHALVERKVSALFYTYVDIKHTISKVLQN